MKKYHQVNVVEINSEVVRLRIDSKLYEFELSEISEKLVNATDIERNLYDISPSGYGIHWPLLDEDLSIDGFLGITHRPKRINTYVDTSNV